MLRTSMLMPIRTCIRAVRKRLRWRHSRLRWSSTAAATQVPWRARQERIPAREAARLHALWLEVGDELDPIAIEQADILHFALGELNRKLTGSDREDVLMRLLFKLCDTFDLSKLAV